jgi:hypothetical protein
VVVPVAAWGGMSRDQNKVVVRPGAKFAIPFGLLAGWNWQIRRVPDRSDVDRRTHGADLDGDAHSHLLTRTRSRRSSPPPPSCTRICTGCIFFEVARGGQSVIGKRLLSFARG